jgi:hypothetical protein
VLVSAARLILIDGMIGAGKSTLARDLEAWLAGRGERARAYNEFADDHPIRTQAIDRLRAAFAGGLDPAASAAAAAEPADFSAGPGGYPPGQWRALAERCLRGPETVILESTFLQNSVLPAFTGGAPAAELTGLFSAIEEEAAAAEPFLVYLRPSDIAAGIAEVHRDRGADWAAQNIAWVRARPWAQGRDLHGREAVVQLYREWEQVVGSLLARHPFGKVVVTDPQQDRAAALSQVQAALRPEAGVTDTATATSTG